MARPTPQAPEGLDLAASRGEGQSGAMTRTKVLVLLALLLGITGSRFGCRSLAVSAHQGRLAAMLSALQDQGRTLPEARRRALREGLGTAEQLLDEGRVSPVALDTLRNRWEAVLADGLLTVREADHLLELLNDIPHWRDAVHAEKYAGQR